MGLEEGIAPAPEAVAPLRVLRSPRRRQLRGKLQLLATGWRRSCLGSPRRSAPQGCR
jgi:hypothetical protein